jgi:hypothetical protein
MIFASGMNSSGWAFVVSAGKRYADEGYFEGTTYDGNSLFECRKEIKRQSFSQFHWIYTPNSRGKNSPNSAEVTELTSETYNLLGISRREEKKR